MSSPANITSVTDGAVLLHHLHLPAMIVDVSGSKVTVVDANEEMAAICGRVPDTVFNSKLEWLVGSRRAQFMESHFWTCIAERRRVCFEGQHSIDGDDRWFAYTLSPLMLAETGASSVLCVAEDISRLRSRSITDARKQADLRKRVNDLMLYSSVAAHDLRSPMCQLDLMLELVCKDFQDLCDGKAEMLATSRSVVAKSIDYLDDVLRQCSAEIEEKSATSELDVSALCRDLAMLLDPNARHEISCDWAVVECNRTIVQIVLRNLIDNAIKHNAGDRLEIEVDVFDAKGGWLVFTVRDNGKGFEDPAAILRHSGDSTSGFGLQGIQQLLSAQSGNIRITGRDSGQGAKVMFSVPGKFRRVSSSRKQAA